LKKLPVVFSRRAETELDRIEDFIAADNPEAATTVRREIAVQAIRLGGFPDIGWALKDPKRTQRSVALAGHQIP
jgi:plasmid stabilization system protein ParE